MENSGIIAGIVFQLGPLQVTNTVVTTWVIMGVIAVLGWLITRHLRMEPGPVQTAAEGVISAIEESIDAVAPGHMGHLLPFIGTLWLFLIIANLSGLIPGVHSPTRDLSATLALAILVFLSVHWFGIRTQGVKAYLHHYLRPSPIMLPFHIISEVTRTIALAVRLFGNIMSLEMTALLILLVAGFLAPIPILMLHIIEALVQAYIFGMLALIYVAGSVQSQQLTQQKHNEQIKE
ncbi:MAG: F0F1 ATP synthase subunit A [gamma proteobacterium endosymbiont of Lamellibrachia anaximandri]|nr:F0F1 ATP synthase subunit A [gamma proteobacterium endosymbiont of Lamellibrachia anaximandri]MBL3535192.1 F0F1 ATP synthase subunit A [gamma proteobacterium endosymbiont of Lamellibrachia anaximandri]